jgi:hypothetical protein
MSSTLQFSVLSFLWSRGSVLIRAGLSVVGGGGGGEKYLSDKNRVPVIQQTQSLYNIHKDFYQTLRVTESKPRLQRAEYGL